MAYKIESLSPEQEAELPQIRDEWIDIGLCTAPADKSQAEDGVKMSYDLNQLKEPREILWADSPEAGLKIAYHLATDKDPDKASRQELVTQLPHAMFGQHETWLSFYDTFIRFGVEGLDNLKGLMQIARSAGWWWAYEHTAVVTERPNRLLRDNLGRLHSEDGLAIGYPDNWGVYAWHGTRVPRDLIVDGWSAAQILQEPNSEIRRCAIERVGWDTFIVDSGMKRVGDRVPDPGNEGQFLELYDLPDALSNLYDDRARILLCTNGSVERDGTRRRYGMPVPARHSDPVAAAADLVGWSPERYREMQVRR